MLACLPALSFTGLPALEAGSHTSYTTVHVPIQTPQQLEARWKGSGLRGCTGRAFGATVFLWQLLVSRGETSSLRKRPIENFTAVDK